MAGTPLADFLADIEEDLASRKVLSDGYFGTCPDCGKSDGYINIGKSHWFYCAEHRVKWMVGANLFSTWQNETEDHQRRKYAELGFGEFRDFTAEAANTRPSPSHF